VQVTGRLGTSRVFRLPPPPREPGQMGRPARHGAELRLAADAARPEPDAGPAAADLCWQAFLRRFDLRHTFRFLKQALGRTRPKLRDPAAADRWTWLVLAAFAQLWLARRLAADERLPWQQPCLPGRLTPARVRRGFRAIHGTMPVLTAAPKPGRPGPGRPPGAKNRRPATRHDVGKAARELETSSSAAG
jgi:hypothetical protein